MIGIVVVSHSHALASAAVALAAEMVPADARPAIAVAAGLDEATFGTDAAAVSAAIEEVDTADGVLVFLDLGSAILSAEMALEFCDPDVAARVKLTSAPLVEGLVAAVVTAATGATLAEVDAEARSGLFAKREHLGDSSPEPVSSSPEPVDPTPISSPSPVEGTFAAPVPHGLHARPAAALVAALRGLDARVVLTNVDTGRSANARSLSQVAALGALAGHLLTAHASGPDALSAVGVLKDLSDANFGDPLPGSGAAASETGDPSTGSESEAGSGAQAGGTTRHQGRPASPPRRTTAVGPVIVRRGEPDLSGYQPDDPHDERARSEAAKRRVASHLATLGEGDAIFAAQAALLDDPELADEVDSALAAGSSAPRAWKDALERAAGQLEALADPYLRERAQDVRSVLRLVSRALADQPLTDDPEATGVLVLGELDAATAKALDSDRILGVITTFGGATGHGVLVATSRGIPVLAGHREAAELAADTLVAIDPATDELVVEPDEAYLSELAHREQHRRAEAAAELELAHEPSLTRDGARILVEVNISTMDDARLAGELGADGVGVLRTEILFAESPTPPTAEQQAELYLHLADLVGGKPLTIRTWDAGGDKPLPFLSQAPEANPFLGERGLRTMRRVPELFAEQLRAICQTGAKTPVRILLPMVTNPDEVVWARAVLDAVRAALPAPPPIEVGIMIEVPAAAIRCADFAGLVDFVSIGTNDLTQYTLAADRANAGVAHLAPPGHPAVLDLIAATCAGLADVPAAVCGDLASDPRFTRELIALGVTELSVRPMSVPAIKAAVRAS